MKLIIGLGNPGKEYAINRHNAGFIVIDELRKLLDFPQFKAEKKFEAEVSEGLSSSFLPLGEGARRADEGERVILMKPQTFMNLSGKSAQALMNFYKIPVNTKFQMILRLRDMAACNPFSMRWEHRK